jgi:periplasmic divalent cation tolerance protein
MTEKIVILCTCASEAEAARLARLLVEGRLAACVNVLPHVRSYYRWQGKVEASEELLLIVKSTRERFEEIRRTIEGAHSYEVPEIVALPVVAGSPAYLAWMDENLKDPGTE